MTKTKGIKKFLSIFLAAVVIAVALFANSLTAFAVEYWNDYKAAVIEQIPVDTEDYDELVEAINGVTSASHGNLIAGSEAIVVILEQYGLTTTVDVNDYFEYDGGGKEITDYIGSTVYYERVMYDKR